MVKQKRQVEETNATRGSETGTKNMRENMNDE